MTADVQEFARRVDAALREIGRTDIIETLVYFNDDGWLYAEPTEELSAADLTVLERAETISR